MRPADSQPNAPPSRHHDRLVRGALINSVGLGARLIQPALIIAITWMYGPAVMGLYFLATFILDLAAATATSGFLDATTIMGSRYADNEHDEERAGHLYHTIGSAFQWGTVFAVVMTLILFFGAGPLAVKFYPDYPELAAALAILSLTIPFIAWSQIAVAATRARMLMQYDAAIMGFLAPFLRLAFATIAWFMDASVVGLMYAVLVAEMGTAAAAAWAYGKHFDVVRTLRIAVRPVWNGELLRFAIPQSLNMTFNRYLTRIDVMMLAAFGIGGAQIAFYATGALITSNLRQVRLVFSSALAPVAARHHHEGDRRVLEDVVSRVSRWTTTLIIPIALVVVVFRGDLLRFVDAAYVGDSTFMAILLLSPLVNCTLGLAGNCIVYTGHTTWTLANSLLVALLNTVLNLVLIPTWGLVGAATATAAAATMIAVLQLIELRALEGVTIRLEQIKKPLIGLALAGFVLWALWDPAGMPVAPRIAAGLAMPVGFFVLMALLGHPEVGQVMGRLFRKRAVKDHA